MTYPLEGTIEVDKEKCPKDLQEKAEQSILELGLNTNRLMLLRNGVYEQICDQMKKCIESAMDESKVFEELANMSFCEKEEEWPEFFSYIRWFLSHAAEKRLEEINYGPYF